MKLYLAGPMRGIEDLNFPAFDEAAERLRVAGYDVFNPADHDRKYRAERDMDPTIRECLWVDLQYVLRDADGIAVLTGWQHSLGTQAEVATARAIGIPVDWVSSWVGRALHSRAREAA